MSPNFDTEKTVYLIDGSSFLYRAYYGTRPLHTPQGVPVQAVYSFCRMIKKLMDKFDPHYMAIVWDSKGKTVRHEIYQDYKATRQAPPSDLFMQKEFIVKFAELIGLAQLEKSGLEADDLMFSLAQERNKEGDFVVLITSDKDMGQTLNEKTVLYDAFKDSIIDVAAFQEKMKFSPTKLPFYFALVGDTSDNIPGVKGIGDKGATELVQQFSSLQDLYNNLDKVEKKRTQMALMENTDNAFLSEKLFLLRYNTTGLQKHDLAFHAGNWAKARPIFLELNFKSLLKDLELSEPPEKKIEKMLAYDFRTVTTVEQLRDLCAEITRHKKCAIDTETTGLNPMQDALVGISVCVQEGTSYYIPIGHNVSEKQCSQADINEWLKPVLEDPSIEKYLHNTKFDQHVLAHAGIELRGVSFDSMLAANLLTEDWQRIGLKYLSEFYFNEPMLDFADVVTRFKRKDFSYVPLDEATQYAACDAHQTLKLTKLFKQEFKKNPVLERLFELIDMSTSQVLFEMELEGIYVDVDMLNLLGESVGKKLRALELEILQLIGVQNKEINLNSPKQIEQLLFYELKLPPQKKSAKGSFSTDQEVLEALIPLHPVPALIIKYRELFKLKSTYIDALPLCVNPTTKKIHTTFNQIAVATGRLSSHDPNLQNIPASGEGIEIRAAFKPEEGHSFLSADYSQIELRVLAYFSQDERLVQAFLHGTDIHAQTAAVLFGVALDQVTHEQRQIGKRINFSILYGLTPYGLSKDLKISFKDAKKYIETYFEQYPRVSAWMESVVEETKKHGYVETLWGRRRYIPTIYESNRPMYEEARRIAINTKAQGTAAEIMKLGMVAVNRALKENDRDAHIVLQIHDELLMSVDNEQLGIVEQEVKKILEGVVTWNIPLRVTTRRGKDWKEVTK